MFSLLVTSFALFCAAIAQDSLTAGLPETFINEFEQKDLAVPKLEVFDIPGQNLWPLKGGPLKSGGHLHDIQYMTDDQAAGLVHILDGLDGKETEYKGSLEVADLAEIIKDPIELLQLDEAGNDTTAANSTEVSAEISAEVNETLTATNETETLVLSEGLADFNETIDDDLMETLSNMTDVLETALINETAEVHREEEEHFVESEVVQPIEVTEEDYSAVESLVKLALTAWEDSSGASDRHAVFAAHANAIIRELAERAVKLARAEKASQYEDMVDSIVRVLEAEYIAFSS